MAHKFLGRTLDTNTMTYRFSDGSEPLPVEMEEDVLSAVALSPWNTGVRALGTIFEWKKRLAAGRVGLQGEQ